MTNRDIFCRKNSQTKRIYLSVTCMAYLRIGQNLFRRTPPRDVVLHKTFGGKNNRVIFKLFVAEYMDCASSDARVGIISTKCGFTMSTYKKCLILIDEKIHSISPKSYFLLLKYIFFEKFVEKTVHQFSSYKFQIYRLHCRNTYI